MSIFKNQPDLFAPRPERRQTGSSHTADLPLFTGRVAEGPKRGGSQVDMFAKYEKPQSAMIFWRVRVIGPTQMVESEDGLWQILPMKQENRVLSYPQAARLKLLEVRRRTTAGEYIKVLAEVNEMQAKLYAQRAVDIEHGA